MEPGYPSPDGGFRQGAKRLASEPVCGMAHTNGMRPRR